MRTLHLNLGTHQTIRGLYDAVERSPYHAVCMVELLFAPEFSFAPKGTTTEIALLTLDDLGYKRNPWTGDINSLWLPTMGEALQRARALGFGPCPHEVIPQLALQYKQPDYEYLLTFIGNTTFRVSAQDGRPEYRWVVRNFVMGSHRGGGNISGCIGPNGWPCDLEDLMIDTWPWRAETALALAPLP